jgi:hypothetical protein
MEMRFMSCIYVEHIFVSSIKRKRTENKSARLDSLLHASRARIRSTISSDLHRILQASSAGVFIAESREIVQGSRSEFGEVRVVQPRPTATRGRLLVSASHFIFFPIFLSAQVAEQGTTLSRCYHQAI